MHGEKGEAAPQLAELVGSIERYCSRRQANRQAELLGALSLVTSFERTLIDCPLARAG
jgi:hypothetical protein